MQFFPATESGCLAVALEGLKTIVSGSLSPKMSSDGIINGKNSLEPCRNSKCPVCHPPHPCFPLSTARIHCPSKGLIGTYFVPAQGLVPRVEVQKADSSVPPGAPSQRRGPGCVLLGWGHCEIQRCPREQPRGLPAPTPSSHSIQLSPLPAAPY